jgi:precorrin-2 dehydrogenase/sirohydrochlorin ferrochelatase
LYPVFLDIKGKPCLVVGGGEVAFRKTETLLKSGATQVKVVAPLLHPGFAKLGEKGKIKFFRRKFRLSDLKGAAIVVCSTDSEEVNALVGEAAVKSGALVNVVDRPALCNFIVPAVLRNGPLTIAVSTGGASPALAKKIRVRLQKTYGGAFAKKVEALRKLRVKMLAEKTAPGKLAAKRAYFRLLRQI